MKTIDNVRVFWVNDLYEVFLENEKLEENEESYKLFKGMLSQNNLVTDDCYAIGYNVDTFLGRKSRSFIERLEYLEEGNEIRITSMYDPHGMISVTWELVYDSLVAHECKEDYFTPEDIEKLLLGELSYDDFVNKTVNKFAIDYIQAFILEDIINNVKSMKPETLKWE